MVGILDHLTDDKKGIRENFIDKYLEFYVAGYTKECLGIMVQQNHARLYSDACKVKIPNEKGEFIFPFGYLTTALSEVRLTPDNNNKYDPNAMIVEVEHPYNIEKYMAGTSMGKINLVLGYVPKFISRVIKNNLDSLGTGWIKKVRTVHNGKSCSTKVAISWANDLSCEDMDYFERLYNVIEELE